MRPSSPFAVALAALLAAPVAASAAPARRFGTTRGAEPAAAPAPFSRDLKIGGMVGLELGDLDGFTLRLDAEIPIVPLGSAGTLAGVGSVGYTRLTKTAWIGDVTWNVVTVIPAARFEGIVAPRVGLYGDVGAGLYTARFSTDTGVSTISDSTTGFAMRLAGGCFYELTPKMRLGAEIGFVPYFGKADMHDATLLVGAMFTL